MAQSVGAVALDIVMGKNTVSSAVSRVADDAKRSFGGMSGNVSAVNKVLKETQGDLSEVDRLLKIDPRNTVLLEQKQRMLNSSISDTKLKLSELETASAKANKELANGDITQAQYDELQREIIETEQDLKSLEAQAKQTSPEMLKITQTQEDFKNLGSKISSVGSACKQVGKSLLPVSLAATGVIKSTADAAMSFETAMAQVKTIAGDASVSYKGNMTDMSKAITSLSKDTGIAAEDIAAATYGAISAGVDVSKSVEFVATANALAVGGFTDMTTSVDVLTTTLNAYGDKAGTAESISDKLITTQNLGKTTVNELASSMGKVIPTASAYNVSLDNLCSTYVAMTKGGIATAEATTYTKSMLTELAKSGSTVGKVLQEETGKSFGQLMADGYSLADVIDILGKSVDGDKEKFAQLWGSTEAGTGALAILNGGTADFNNTLKEMGNSTGSASDAMNKMNDTSAHKMQVAMNDMKLAAIELGGAFAPVMTGIASVISKVATAFSKLSPEAKKVIAVILSVVAVAAPLLVTIGSVVGAIGKVMGAVSTISGAVSSFVGFISSTVMPALSSLFTFIAANPIVLAIGAVVAAGVVLIKNWDSIKELAGYLKEAVVEGWNNLKEKTAETWGNIKNKVSNTWNNIKEKTSNTVTNVKNKVSGAWNNVKTKTTETFNNVKNKISNTFNNIKTSVSEKVTSIKNKVSNTWNNIKDKTSSIFSSVKNAVSEKWSAIKNAVSEKANAAKEAANKAWNGIKTGISSAGSKIKESVTNCFNGARDKIKGFAKQAVGWGKDFAEGLASGIKGAAGKVVDAAKGLGSKIKEYLHFSRPDKGPLRDYETWMPDFMDGLKKGIENNQYKVVNSVKNLAGSMANSLSAVKKVKKNKNTKITSGLSEIDTNNTEVLKSINMAAKKKTTVQAPKLKNSGKTNQTKTEENYDSKIYKLLETISKKLNTTTEITIPVYLGNDLIDEMIIKANDRITVRSGGNA